MWLPWRRPSLVAQAHKLPLIGPENARIDALAARATAIYAEIGKSVELSGNGGASESALAMAEGEAAVTRRSVLPAI